MRELSHVHIKLFSGRTWPRIKLAMTTHFSMEKMPNKKKPTAELKRWRHPTVAATQRIPDRFVAPDKDYALMALALNKVFYYIVCIVVYP